MLYLNCSALPKNIPSPRNEHERKINCRFATYGHQSVTKVCLHLSFACLGHSTGSPPRNATVPQARGVQNFAAEICAAKCWDNVVRCNLDKFWRLSVLDKHVVARSVAPRESCIRLVRLFDANPKTRFPIQSRCNDYGATLGKLPHKVDREYNLGIDCHYPTIDSDAIRAQRTRAENARSAAK